MGGVDLYFHRVPELALDASPWDLRDRVPTWPGDEFESALADGTLMLIEEDYLLVEALLSAIGDPLPDSAPAHLVVSGGAWHPTVEPEFEDELVDDMDVGVLLPDQVQAASRFLQTVDVDQWISERSTVLATAKAEISRHPWDTTCASHLARDVRELVALFERAADNGEAIVKIFTV